MRNLTCILAAVLVVTGCPTRDQFFSGDDSGGGGQAGGGGDVQGAGGTAVAGAGGTPGAPNTVTITAPTATSYTNGSITISISTAEPTTSPVTITANGASVGTIPAPERSLIWSTGNVPEGTYSVAALLPTQGMVATSNRVTVVVDRTPPEVVVSSLVPSPGSSEVVLAAPITVSFSEPLLASTVDASSITLRSGSDASVPTSVSLSADGKTATISVTSDRTVTLGTFTCLLGGAITDLAGNPLAPPSATWSWTVPPWIEYAGINSNSPPLLAVGSDFQPRLAYTVCGLATASNACPTVIHVAANDGQIWTDLGALPGGTNTAAAAMFLDARNLPTVGFGTQTIAGVGEVVFASWDGSAWQTTSYATLELPSSAGTSVDAIAITQDPAGRPWVAYRGELSAPTPSTEIFVAAWTGTAWDTSYGAVGDQVSKTFDLLVSEQSLPIVTVANGDNTSGAFLWNGASWSLFAGGAGAPNGSAGLDQTGNPLMLGTAGGNWLPAHLTSGSWLPSVSSPVPSSASASDPRITNTLDFEPVVAWYEPATTPGGIGLGRWNGSAWDVRAGVANAGGSANVMSPPVVVDARNDIWIAWTEDLVANVWMSNY